MNIQSEPPNPLDNYVYPTPDAGHHNVNLDESNARFIAGHTWKKQGIAVLIPADKMVPLKCAMSWWGLIFPPNNTVVKLGLVGHEVGQAYSNCIQMILDDPNLSKLPYILTIEHDNCPPQDGVLRLLQRMEDNPEFSVISGLYWTKGVGGCPQIWGDINDPVINYRPQPVKAGKLVECYGTGMGFALWRTSMFKDPALRRPWFRTVASKEEGVGTQDLWFAQDAQKHGYRFAVDCATLVGHWDANAEKMW